MDAGSILGLSALRPPLLVHVPAAEPREARTRRVMTTDYDLDDDDVDDPDDDDDFDEDEDDEDDDEDEDEDVETWQVADSIRFR